MNDETKRTNNSRMFAFDMESLMRMGVEDETASTPTEAAQGQPAEAMEPELKRLKEIMGWK